MRSNRTINVEIPAGVASGSHVHLVSQGEVGPGGGPAGDLYVELTIAPHEVFTRNGDDLEVVVKVPMTAAALGTQVTLDTLEAERDDLDAELSTVAVDIPGGHPVGHPDLDRRTGRPAAAPRRARRAGRDAAGADPDEAGRRAAGAAAAVRRPP